MFRTGVLRSGDSLTADVLVSGDETVAPKESRRVVYERKRGWSALELKEVWAYRELLFFLTWRDVLVRYKQAVLGVLWAVLQPVLTMVVFTVVFNGALGVDPKTKVAYPVFSFTGLLPWQFFAGALSRAGLSLVGNANLLTKVYFPRLVIPMSAVFAAFVDFVISFAVLVILMAIYGVVPGWELAFLPLFVILAIVAALSISLWLSALDVLYRDVQYVIPFLIQLWMFVSPVIYSVDDVPSGVMRAVFALNPMTGVIGGFRWALLGDAFPGGYLWVSVGIIAVALVTGLYYFKRVERVFADVV